MPRNLEPATTSTGINTMNIYEYPLVCKCLVDNKSIRYQIKIETPDQLMAEDLIGFQFDDPNIQESIADALYDRFGGTQTIVGVHSGVKITTRRG
jgi:hypothetical protein